MERPARREIGIDTCDSPPVLGSWSGLVAPGTWGVRGVVASRRRRGPHFFSINYTNFEDFSVQIEHRKAIVNLARWITADADAWDEYLEPSQAQSQAISTFVVMRRGLPRPGG